MSDWMEYLCQGVPVLIGIGVVAVTAILAKIFLFGDKKKKSPVTLQDPTVKYPFKLVDKEVSVLKALSSDVTSVIILLK